MATSRPAGGSHKLNKKIITHFTIAPASKRAGQALAGLDVDRHRKAFSRLTIAWLSPSSARRDGKSLRRWSSAAKPRGLLSLIRTSVGWPGTRRAPARPPRKPRRRALHPLGHPDANHLCCASVARTNAFRAAEIGGSLASDTNRCRKHGRP